MRNVAWLFIVGGLMVGGQSVRLWHLLGQSDRINNALRDQYVSVLGEDIGTEPFGRLQFEAGKLQVERKIGLDPLRVMAALSRNDTIGLRIYDITLSGLSGYVRGEMAPDRSALNAFLERLSEDDAYAFTLTDSVQAEGAVRFTLEVGRR